MKRPLIFDFDAQKYTIASACEKRSIQVVHTKTGKKKEFDNRTAFYGNWRKKDGGWLAEVNLERQMDNKRPFLLEEFEITDVQTPEPLEFCLSSVKNQIKNIVEHLDAPSYYGYLGKGDSWRTEASTLVKYKGSREKLLKPIHLEEVEKYLITNHNATIIRGLEADDKCVIDCTENPDKILIGIDKDYRGCNLTMYTHDGENTVPETFSGFGKLYINDKKAIKGYGYLWWLFQVMYGDDSDEYWANSATTTKWGEKSAYKLLADCKNEKEAWEAVIKGYKKLYPEPKMFTGWRGDEFEIDWRYVLNENCVMSRMMTSEDYKFNLDEELDKYGVKCD